MESLRKLDPRNKKILVRLDFDVPIKGGTVVDTFRLDAVFETLKYLEPAKKLYLIGHANRPEGKVVEDLRLRPQAEYLAQKLGLNFSDRSCKIYEHRYLLGDKIEILENLRFFKGEEENNEKFAKKYTRLSEIFVFEAFAVSHRKHASIFWSPKLLPSFMGLRTEKEIIVLSELRNEADQSIALVGGAKASDKADLILKFKALKILLGGKTASELWLKKGEAKKGNIIFPVDGILENGSTKLYSEMDKAEIMQVRDIGEKTIIDYSKIFNKEGKNIIFSGPMGQFEKEKFSQGTKKLYQTAIKSGKNTILLGGDSAYAAEKFKLRDKFSYVSVGGGASLNFLAGGKIFLPLS